MCARWRSGSGWRPGSRVEPEPLGGISHLIEHLVFKGTASRSAEDIARAIDSVGGHMDAFTAKEHTCFYVRVIDEHLPLAVDLLTDILRHPRFAADDIEKEKAVVLQEIKMVEDTPDDLIHDLFAERVWAGPSARAADPRAMGRGEGLRPGRPCWATSSASTSRAASWSRWPGTSSTRGWPISSRPASRAGTGRPSRTGSTPPAIHPASTPCRSRSSRCTS